MTDHPYRRQPDRAFWSRAVSTSFNPADLSSPGEPLMRAEDHVVSAGSCFAAHMIPWLEAAGLTYVRAEPPTHAFSTWPRTWGTQGSVQPMATSTRPATYDNSWNGHTGVLSRWRIVGMPGSHVIDPFRPGLRYPARSDREFDLLTTQHLEAVRAAIGVATVFVFTLGLTEAWELAADGAVFPACPGTIAGTFSPVKHRFHNFGVEEVRGPPQFHCAAPRSQPWGARHPYGLASPLGGDRNG